MSDDLVDETWDDDRFLNGNLLSNRILDYLTRLDRFLARVERFLPKEK
jgi:hypothetical protein